MEAARGVTGDSRFDGLHAEASAAVGSSANTLREVRERYRAAYADSLARWQALRTEAEAISDDARLRALRVEVELLAAELDEHRSGLARLELAEETLSRTWLFLKRDDSTLIAPGDSPDADGGMAMRIVEAQEAERARIAHEIHDGPAQALSKAIFQADYTEKLSATDSAAATAEIRKLRDLLRRELDDLRGFISQLRPPMLEELGLDGAIEEAVKDLRAVSELQVTSDLRAPNDVLDVRQQTVALRVTQEALQNVRKHADASTVVVRTDVADDAWTLEIRDDGRGFDVGAAAARGRRNFGLQFMRERAELIDARFDVRSRADGGTVVRLEIPTGARTGEKENG
jgi:two-component system sensor histidine kinase DegS